MNQEAKTKIQCALDLARLRCEYCIGDEVICRNLKHDHNIDCTVLAAERALHENDD